jgi:general secretion pathway protein A
MLTNLETAKYKLIHVILLGQPEFDDILAKPEFFPLKQRITVRYHLHPLSYKETREYILYRLKRAGARNLAIFNESAIKEIYNYSQGIPRLINIVCDNALLTGFATEQGRINKEIVQNVISDLESGARSQRRKNQHRLPAIIISVIFIAVLIAAFIWYILN